MANTTLRPVGSYLLLANGDQLPIAGDLQVNSNTEYMRSMTSTLPDITWSVTDAHGHEHRYVRDDEGVPRLPSMKTQQGEEYWCEDCHDFHSDSEWVCRECGDVVEPGFKPDYKAATSGIPVWTDTEWTVSVDADVPFGVLLEDAKVVVPTERGEQHYEVPPLSVISRNGTSDSTGMRITTQLSGGMRKAVERKPTGP